MRKRLLPKILAVVMTAALLAGCGQTPGGNEESGSSGSGSSAEGSQDEGNGSEGGESQQAACSD